MTWQVVPGGSGMQASRAASPQTKEPGVFGKQVRVLVVDDEPSICKALVMALSRAGYDATAAQTGEAALGILRTQHVDVMLIDLRIPDMRGDVIFEVAIGHQPHLRYQTLFMTGDITDRAQKLIGICKCPFLRKPFDLRDMFDSVAALAPRMEQDAAG
ncbi:MAG TPA: response regulator [Gemmatimonadaceae bacterium]|nr:response regulator [Gemmatimonadaceae bacterium]